MAQAAHRERLHAVEAYLVETGQIAPIHEVSAHWRLMSDNVAHAIMRRISRESVYTARVIDDAAKLLNDVMSELGVERAVVPDFDRLDRLTIKVLIRAMLVLAPDAGFAWEWRSDSDPVADFQTVSCHYLSSRTGFLRQAVGIVDPTFEHIGLAGALDVPTGHSSVTMMDISIALVLQNYDACLLWTPAFFENEDCRAEAYRLLGLTLVNVSSPAEACAAWRKSSEHVADEARAAHLRYLCGLVEAKRSYDLTVSDKEFVAGLALLDAKVEASEEDRELERAWLLNGLALNQAITWRKGGDKIHFNQAFSHLRTAFSLAAGGSSPAHNYLRFNLIANMAFLMEMAGRYRQAIEVFNKVFSERLLTANDQGARLRGTLSYRVGVLKWKAGERADALDLLEEALAAETEFGLWSMREHVLRAQGIFRLQDGQTDRAIDAFERGLNLSLAERSAQGAREHASGLVQALLAKSDEVGARRLCETLERDEQILLAAGAAAGSARTDIRAIRPHPPASKLPAYIPEIDLEGIPKINLNQFLAGSSEPAAKRVFATT